MADVTVSGVSDPYAVQSYSASSNDKNTLTITDYFKLLAAQLANQDMNNPMDNSEMMAQMTQMAMVQSMTAMTESIQTSTATTTQTYAAGLIGQEVTMAVMKEGANGLLIPVDVKYGKVEAVNLTDTTPTVKLENDSKFYPLSYILGLGKLDNPYSDTSGTGKDDDDDDNNVGGVDGDKDNTGSTNGDNNTTGGVDNTEGTGNTGSTDDTEGTGNTGNTDNGEGAGSIGSTDNVGGTDNNNATDNTEGTENGAGVNTPQESGVGDES